MKIAVIAIIVGTFTLCSSFEILLNGEATTRARFCIGDRITLVCNGNTASYAWQIPSLGIDQSVLTVTQGNRERDIQGFTAEYVSDTVTMLNFTAREDINGSDILCVDFINDIVLTSKVFSLHDVPDTPPIVYTSTNADLSSFDIRISSNSSDEATICVNQYNISITGDDGQSQFAMVPRNDSVTYNSNTVFGTGFDLCTTMYTLTVVASNGGSSIMTDIITTFQGVDSITAMKREGYIILQLPQVLQDCMITNYTYSFNNSTGTVSTNNNEIMLSEFDTESCPNNPMLRLYPVILGEAQSTVGVSINICDCPTTMLPRGTPDTTMSATASASNINGLLAATVGLILTALSWIA